MKRVALAGHPRIIGTIAIAAAVAALGAAGCGGDESGDTISTFEIPSVTAPTTSSTAAQDTETTTYPDTTPNVTTTGGGKYDPSAPDSETNDVPPPAGSPQEQFEQNCQQNGACGD